MLSVFLVLMAFEALVRVDVINYGISPYEVTWSQQVEAVVGEVFSEFAVIIHKERIEVNPSHSLPFAHFLHSSVAVDYYLFAVFQEFPHLHVGVER